jgi:hypothetical protein
MKYTKGDLDVAIENLIELFGDEGFDLEVKAAERDGKHGWKSVATCTVPGPFGLEFTLKGHVTLNYAQNAITFSLAQSSVSGDRIYATYISNDWQDLNWRKY